MGSALDKKAESLGVSSSTPIKVMVAASGTGGHLIPALHIVEAVRRLEPSCVVEFVGAGRPLEDKLIVEKGFQRHIVASAGIKRRHLLGVFQFIFRLPRGFWQVLSLYRSFRPDVVIGVGGYVSVLPVMVARVLGIPTWIHEAELHPGLANRLLCHFADRISTAFSETRVRGRARHVHTGHPVREELKRIDTKAIRPDAPKRLLVLGGSQGARGLDESVAHIGPILSERGVEVVHQCRPDSMELVVNAYRAAGVAAHVVNFIDDMPGAYEWADVAISRAGASSVAEISCVNRPTIFVPYPFQQGTHQTDNARVLVKRNKAFLVEETDPNFVVRLKELVERLLTPSVFKEMKSASLENPSSEAASQIAQGVLELVKSRK